MVLERCRLVARWAAGRAEAIERAAGDVEGEEAGADTATEGLRALAGQASALGELAATHGGPLSEGQVARLLDAVRLDGVAVQPHVEAAGGPWHVTSLAQVTRPVGRLVWLGLGTADPPDPRWTAAETRALRAARCDVDDGSRELGSLRAAERRGFLQVRERLLAVGLPGDEERRPHPLWQEIAEGLRVGGKPARPTPLRLVIAGGAAGEVLPWGFPTTPSPAPSPSPAPPLPRPFPAPRAPPSPRLPPPRARPLWRLPAGLVRDRETCSASSLQDELACPLKWVLKYQADLRPAATASIPADFPLRGDFSHAVLGEVFGGPGPCPSEEEAVARVAALFDERLPLDAAPLAQPGRIAEGRRLRVLSQVDGEPWETWCPPPPPVPVEPPERPEVVRRREKARQSPCPRTAKRWSSAPRASVPYWRRGRQTSGSRETVRPVRGQRSRCTTTRCSWTPPSSRSRAQRP